MFFMNVYRALPRLRQRPKLRPLPLLSESSCIGYLPQEHAHQEAMHLSLRQEKV